MITQCILAPVYISEHIPSLCLSVSLAFINDSIYILQTHPLSLSLNFTGLSYQLFCLSRCLYSPNTSPLPVSISPAFHINDSGNRFLVSKYSHFNYHSGPLDCFHQFYFQLVIDHNKIIYRLRSVIIIFIDGSNKMGWRQPSRLVCGTALVT